MRIEARPPQLYTLPPESITPTPIFCYRLDQDACRSGSCFLTGNKLYLTYAESACYPYTTLYEVDLENEEHSCIEALESYRSHCADHLVITEQVIYEIDCGRVRPLSLPLRKYHVIEGVQRTGSKLVVHTKLRTRVAGEHHAEVIVVDLESRYTSKVYREDHTLYDALLLDEDRMLLSYWREGSDHSELSIWNKEERTRRTIEVNKDHGRISQLQAWDENRMVGVAENRAPGIAVYDFDWKQQTKFISMPEQEIRSIERYDDEHLLVVHQHRNTPSHQGLMLSVVNIESEEIVSEVLLSDERCVPRAKPFIDVEGRRIAFVGYPPLHYSEEGVHVIEF